MKNSKNDHESGANPVNGGEWFDIDAFLDDYVNDLDNHDPLDQINLDFSLPFPQSKTADALAHFLPHPVPAPPMLKEEEDIPMPEPTSDSDHPSEHEDQPTKRPQRAARGRGAATRAKSTKSDKSGAAASRPTAEQRKHLALQEKNRRAQRRFRERQKQRVVELEEQVAALSAQLAAVATERDHLAARNQELEAATASGGNTANNNQAHGDSYIHTAAFNLQLPPPTSEACSDAVQSAPMTCPQGVTLTPKLDGPEVVLSPSDLCTMTQQQLSAHFNALVKECAKTFVEDAGTPEVDDRVKTLVDQALNLWQKVALCNPQAAKEFMTCKLDENGHGQPADERAPHIVRSLALDERQKNELCHLRRVFLTKMTSIASARSSTAEQSLGAGVPYGGTSGRALASQQLTARHASRHVANSLQEEHAAAMEFETMVTRQVLNSAQCAQLLIQSYPYPPDVLAIATWIAAEAGESDALGALAAEAQARATANAMAVAGQHQAHNPARKVPAQKQIGKLITAGSVATQSPFLLAANLPSSLLAGPTTSSVNTCAAVNAPQKNNILR